MNSVNSTEKFYLCVMTPWSHHAICIYCTYYISQMFGYKNFFDHTYQTPSYNLSKPRQSVFQRQSHPNHTVHTNGKMLLAVDFKYTFSRSYTACTFGPVAERVQLSTYEASFYPQLARALITCISWTSFKKVEPSRRNYLLWRPRTKFIPMFFTTTNPLLQV